ncbi:MAG TPA: PilZ domain-containing protein [Bryobacteraceae bacterium]|jgi:PilZ domain-containing protein|nr:PilZ domain-containing protein [Bryobacteraceae bacterium]
MRHPESRRHERISSTATVKIRWHGAAGESHFARGKILNCSDTGVCVELVEPIKPLSYVTLNAPELNGADWAAGGAVRYCNAKGLKFHVGVELSAGAKWSQAS